MESNNKNSSNNNHDDGAPFTLNFKHGDIQLIIKRIENNDVLVMRELIDDYTIGSILDILGHIISEGEFSTYQQLLDGYAQRSQRRRCNTVWNSESFIYKCRECQVDENCAICVDCFREELHRGHCYRLVQSSRGCCDCGDESAWRKESTCERHGAHNFVADASFELSVPSRQIVVLLANEFKLLRNLRCEGGAHIQMNMLANSTTSTTTFNRDQEFIDCLIDLFGKLIDVFGDKISLYIGEVFSAFDQTDRNKLFSNVLQLMTYGNEQLERVIVSLFICTELRDELAIYLAENYELIRRLTIKHQRNTVFNLTIQLFSVDSVAYKIISTNRMSYIVNNLLKTFEAAMIDGQIDFKQKIMKDKQYCRPLSDICCIIRNRSSFLWLLENPDQLLQLQTTLLLTQEMGAITKSTQVENEDETWSNRFYIEYYYRKCIFSPLGKFFREISHGQQHIKVFSDNLYSLLIQFYSEKAVWKKGIRDVLIPDYRVSRQPVSFHLPLHRSLITVLLQMSSKFGVHPTTVLAHAGSTLPPPLLIDPLIRVRVLVAQIHAGLWVRNGQCVKLQSLTYLHTYELSHNDFFMLQYVASCMSPVHFYAQLLDRSELATWFTLDGSITKSALDRSATQTKQSDSEKASVVVAEDITSLIIGMVTDRTRLASHTFEDAVRIEIIHHLAVSGKMRHGDIFQRHTELFEKVGAAFDTILASVADFHPPTTTDSGKYELKPQSWAEWTPFYPHYTRQEVQMSTERYQNLVKDATRRGEARLYPDHSKYLESIPATLPCYSGIDQLLHCDILHSIIYSVVFNSLCGSGRFSDHLLTNCIYLIKLILRVYKPAANVNSLVSSSNKSKPSVPKHFEFGFHLTDFMYNLFRPIRPNPHSATHSLHSLLYLMHQSIHFETHHQNIRDCLDHPIVKQFARILDLDNSSNGNASSSLGDGSVKDNGSSNSLGNSMEFLKSQSNAAEHAKELAKKRQQEIMSRFAKQQATFLEDIGDDFDDDEVVQTYGCCVLCKEDLVPKKSSFALLAYLQKNSLLSHVDSIGNSNLTSNHNDAKEYELFRDAHRNDSSFITFCSHSMHLECLEKFKDKKFNCPACRRLVNTHIPFIERPLTPLQADRPSTSTLLEWFESFYTKQQEFNIKQVPEDMQPHHLLSMVVSTITVLELNKRYRAINHCNSLETISQQDRFALQSLIKFTAQEQYNEKHGPINNTSLFIILSSLFSTSERLSDFLNLDMFGMLVRFYLLNERIPNEKFKSQFIDIIRIFFTSSIIQSLIILNRCNDINELKQSICIIDEEVMRLMTPFLRKVFIFNLIINYQGKEETSGAIFTQTFDSPIESQYTSILNSLQLSSFVRNELQNVNGKLVEYCYSLWIGAIGGNRKISLSPVMWKYQEFQFANLEKDYHHFYLESTKKACDICKKKPIGLNPSLCLLCGVYLCEVDEYLKHAQKCGGGGGFGIIFVFAKTVVLIISKSSVKLWSHSIYLDQHGSEDFGFQRGNPLYLNEGRLSRLKSEILSMTLQNLTNTFRQ